MVNVFFHSFCFVRLFLITVKQFLSIRFFFFIGIYIISLRSRGFFFIFLFPFLFLSSFLFFSSFLLLLLFFSPLTIVKRPFRYQFSLSRFPNLSIFTYNLIGPPIGWRNERRYPRSGYLIIRIFLTSFFFFKSFFCFSSFLSLLLIYD